MDRAPKTIASSNPGSDDFPSQSGDIVATGNSAGPNPRPSHASYRRHRSIQSVPNRSPCRGVRLPELRRAAVRRRSVHRPGRPVAGILRPPLRRVSHRLDGLNQWIRSRRGTITMRVLIACEFSGTVRDAFSAAGHYARSVDLLPTESHSQPVKFRADFGCFEHFQAQAGCEECEYGEPYCHVHQMDAADCTCMGPTAGKYAARRSQVLPRQWPANGEGLPGQTYSIDSHPEVRR